MARLVARQKSSEARLMNAITRRQRLLFELRQAGEVTLPEPNLGEVADLRARIERIEDAVKLLLADSDDA